MTDEQLIQALRRLGRATAPAPRFADDLFGASGLDLRGQALHPFFVADIAGGSSVAFIDGQLTITTWKPGIGERTAPLS